MAFLLKKIIFPDIDRTSLIIISSDLAYLEEISRNNQFVLLENYKYYNNYIAEEGLKLGKMGGITESLQLFSLPNISVRQQALSVTCSLSNYFSSAWRLSLFPILLPLEIFSNHIQVIWQREEWSFCKTAVPVNKLKGRILW